MELIPHNIGNFLVQFPFYLVCLVGMVLVVVYWRFHPTAALLTAIALVIFVVTQLLSNFFSAWLPFALQSWRMPVGQMGPAMAIMTLLRSLLNATALALLLVAVFIGRKTS